MVENDNFLSVDAAQFQLCVEQHILQPFEFFLDATLR